MSAENQLFEADIPPICHSTLFHVNQSLRNVSKNTSGCVLLSPKRQKVDEKRKTGKLVACIDTHIHVHVL